MAGTRYAKSQKFSGLSSKERARRISKIRDPKKRASAERFWGVERDGGGFSFGGIGRAIQKGAAGLGENVIKDVPELVRESVESGKQIGGALKSDIQSGRGLWKPGGLLVGESKTGALALDIAKGLPGQAKLLADPKAWYEDPLIQVVNLAGFGLPVARAASVGRLATSIRRANPGMSRAQVNKAAIAESYNPGLLKSKGVKGGIAPRVVKGQYGEAPGKMRSRTPYGRAGQRAFDYASEQLDIKRPGAPLSASRRAQAQNRRIANAQQRRDRAQRQMQEEAVAKAIAPSRRQRAARAMGLAGRTDPAMGAALVAALEGPSGKSVAAAIEDRRKALTSVLEQNDELRPRQDAVDTLKQQRDDLLAEDPEADVADLDTQIKTGQDQLDFLLGKRAPEVSGSPMRDRMYSAMVASVGKKRAKQTIKLYDAAAWANDLDNPAAWYERTFADVRTQPLEAFAPEGAVAYQRMRGSEPERWHFTSQRALESMRGETMQVGQLVGRLQKAGVKGEELRNSGLEKVFRSLGPNTTVRVDDVLDDLRAEGYFERFDPDISFRDDANSGPHTEYGPHDSAMGPGLVSREGQHGEYHEMVITLPDLEREPYVAAYQGRGESHWGADNVVYHVRFQIYEEHGKKTLLIEEIQSDWASDYRRAKKEGVAGEPSPMHQERYLDNAIHNVMRFADDHEVDEVVVIDGGTQALRNRAVQLEDLDDQEIIVDDGFQDYGEWVDRVTGEPLSNEQITRVLESQQTGSFSRIYNETIPDRFRKLYGAEPEYSDSAYVGRYSSSADPYDFSQSYNAIVQTEDTSMPGTVIRLTPEVREATRSSRPLYRRNLEGVPQGATEFLADGRARITMFEKADVSTWVHELAHVALRDLSPDDQAILARELADGRPLDKWTEADNEAYARAFETYMREGYAAPALREIFDKITAWMKDLWNRVGGEAERISPKTADAFDRMLGRRYQNTVLLDDAEVAQVRSDIADLEKALESGDMAQLERAAEALTALAQQAEAAGIKILGRGARDADHLEAIIEGLNRRKNLVVEDYRRRGVIDNAEEARGYFPQFSMWEALGQPQVQPSRIAATGATVGTPRVTSKAVNRNRNKLVRYQTGEVLNDPSAVLYILRARLRLLETIAAREQLWEVGGPIRAGGQIPDDVALVRNPSVQPEKMRTATEAAASLSREDYTKLQARRAVEDADQIDMQGAADEMIYIPEKGKPRPEWTYDEKNVRAVPLSVAQARVGDVFSGAPRGRLGAMLGMANSLARGASIYLPLAGARYVARNWVQNAVMLALTQPSAFGKLISNRKLREDPQLWDEINEEIGTIQAAALPEFNTRAQNRFQRTERNMNRVSGQIGEGLGRFADVPLRVASWRRHAERYGFDTPEGYRRLLRDPDLAETRDMVAQRTREDMIDFDALTPYEKEVLTRYLFIWPFIRGATKWPFMFAREYPGRLTAASLASGATLNEEDDRPVSEQLKLGDFDLSWLNPAGPATENAVRLREFVTRNANGEITLKPLITESLAPQYRTLLDALTGDLGKEPHKAALTTFMPFYSTVEAALGGKQKASEFLQKTVGRQTRPRSVARRADEWMGELDSVLERADKEGFKLPPEMAARVEQMRAAYGDWLEDSSRAEWANMEEGVDEVGQQQRAALILEVAKEHYPGVYETLQQDSRSATGMSAEQAIASDRFDNEAVYKAVYDEMFGLKSEIMADAREAGWVE